MKILVSGATGYVGGKLIPLLAEAGHEVTAMVRDESHRDAFTSLKMRVVIADALQPLSLVEAMRGVDAAYYLIHSMASPDGDFHQRDLLAAKNFAIAARQAGVSRIIYLGGLVSDTSEVSKHLRSRQETGETLRNFGPPLTEFRAGIIVGNGSISFELIRCLTERLPVMICPRWVITRTQPIAIEDVLAYLVATLRSEESTGQIVEIGGATIETYRSMMLTYARARGLKRWLLRVPVLTPRLSSYWLRLVTPIPASIAHPLIEGLRTEVVCKSNRAAELFPEIRPVGYSAAVDKTLNRKLPDDSFRSDLKNPAQHFFRRKDGVVCDVRQSMACTTPHQLFSVITQLGGSNGYLYANRLWRIRGLVDQWLGGVGMTRGPEHSAGHSPAALLADDTFDFWYVQEIETDEHLVLRAAMKLPGRAWLEFILSPEGSRHTLVRCCAWFEPSGLLGELYWWALYPVHILIFRGLVEAVCKKASKNGEEFVAGKHRATSATP
jgi:uncharacterized protein YbjT (DUF2867 family)